MGRTYINLFVDFAPTTEFHRQVVLGATRFCHERLNFRLRTATTETNLAADPEVVDGVIATIERPDPSHRYTRFDKPVVNVSTICHPVPFPTVSIDSDAVGRAAASHLLAAGYRAFAYHMESLVYFSRARYEGFIAGLAAAGHPQCAVFDSSAMRGSTPQELHDATARWLTELPKPLGLFTHNDLRATALIDLCHDAGLVVPEEVGVIGVDNDSLITQMCTPNLSSVDPGTALIGYRAADLLARLIRGEPPPAGPLFLPPRGAVERESTQPSRLADPRLNAALRFIRTHATAPVGVAEVLDAAGCSRRSLERLFRAHLGRSPAEEIRRVQVDHAKRLLAESDRSLTQVSERCGYQSFRNFATAFRREVGMSASSYRRKFKAK